ncbi:Hypothetical Protein FCC1311_035442 [Hondaea fermentalgiana]|uniref:Uncharacterized protein n=1 Tax=Hondaea fermentalgiana TaxID=2315210 RepID=A0A2R5G8D8_9STRA|nr:Hypothetical Protein FCC1311_035442 [Hondaea fermentalgiana]|eukprot:GBG27322.1 Hypothetical Protein FCC1311_035442 [Hondaea fermentalgiana]
MEPQNYGQMNDGTDAWAVHRASQSASMLTQGQMNLMLLSVFAGSFLLNYIMDAGETPTEEGGIVIMGWVLVFLGALVVVMWGLLLYKIRECGVWPEEVRFQSDGQIVVIMGCCTKALDASNNGVTMIRRRVHWNDSLGVFCNVITDKTRDEVFVLVPTAGPRYWYGFAFQPEDPGSFVHDCSHAGVIIEGGPDAELGVVPASSAARSRSRSATFESEEGTSLHEGLLSRDVNTWRAPLRTPAFSRQGTSSRRRLRHPLLEDLRNATSSLESMRDSSGIDTDSDAEHEAEGDIASEHSCSSSSSSDATSVSEMLRKNNNIIEV